MVLADILTMELHLLVNVELVYKLNTLSSLYKLSTSTNLIRGILFIAFILHIGMAKLIAKMYFEKITQLLLH